MATDIKCPNCGTLFPMEEAMAEEYKKDLREKMQEFKKDKEKELQRRQEEFSLREQELLQQSQRQEADFTRKLNEEKQRIQAATEQSLRKSISADFENQLRMLEEANKDNEEKLKTGRQKELEFLKKEQ